MRQIALQHRRRTGAIDIIIAKDRDALAGHDGMRDTRAGPLHIGEGCWIGQQVADRRVQETLRRLAGHTPARKHACHDVGDAMILRNGECRHLLPLVEPMLPGKPGRRFPYAEK